MTWACETCSQAHPRFRKLPPSTPVRDRVLRNAQQNSSPPLLGKQCCARNSGWKALPCWVSLARLACKGGLWGTLAMRAGTSYGKLQLADSSPVFLGDGTLLPAMMQNSRESLWQIEMALRCQLSREQGSTSIPCPLPCIMSPGRSAAVSDAAAYTDDIAFLTVS